MIERLGWFWHRLNANYWFYPALFSVAGALLALAFIYIDRGGQAGWLDDLEWIIPAGPESASNMLQVIAGSMIGVAATVFSITIAAVVYASGNYGPRLLTNFMEDRGNQLSLATFIGTFVYAITVLRAVRKEDEALPSGDGVFESDLPGFVPQLSLLMAYVLAGLSVAVLVYFLNHIPSKIRINTVLEGIGRRLMKGIERSYPEHGTGDGKADRPRGAPLLARASGYVEFIEFDRLVDICHDADCRFVLQVRTGDFVHEGMTLLEVVGSELAEGAADKVRGCFSLGASRTPEQDPQFLLDELVEIGLRALSPSINDPFTAITSLHWLGAATAKIGQRHLSKQVFSDEHEEYPVIPLHDDFHHYVCRGFGTIRSGAATSPVAATVMLDVLRNAAAPLTDADRQGLLLAEGKNLVEQARTALTGPDLAELESHFETFVRTFPPPRLTRTEGDG